VAAQTKAERTAANQLAHFQKRQEERARAVAAKREKDGDPEAWNDLARTISTWVSRYEA
jgi:hypothetical protein